MCIGYVSPPSPFPLILSSQQLLIPSIVSFIIAHLIIVDTFPPKEHALAGAVFNTIAQLGTSIGLSIMAMSSHYVTETPDFQDKSDPGALMMGYRAAFWAAFVMMLLSCVVALGGFRGTGKLGSGVEKESLLRTDEDF